MSSRRLPGKVLMKLGGRELLGWVIDRVRMVSDLSVVVATSVEESDNAIKVFCEREGVQCYRGPLDNVAKRFAMVIEGEGCEAFVRICADSPLIDPKLIDMAVSLYKIARCDLVTNVLSRSFPKGQSIEVVKADTFMDALGHMHTEDHYEHVTSYFYKNHQRYSIVSFSSGFDAATVNLCVDTKEDLRVIQQIVLSGEGSLGGWQSLVGRLDLNKKC